MARNPDLEAAIIQSPEDDNLYRAYADWLEAHGDLRAQLIRAQLVQRIGGAASQLLWDHADAAEARPRFVRWPPPAAGLKAR